MSTILATYKRIKAVNTNEVCVNALSNTAEVIADLVVQQQLKGIRSDGSQILPNYASDPYAEFKHVKNPLPGLGVPDLHLTGAYHRGLKTKVQGDKVITDSIDQKSPLLEKKYGSKKASITQLSGPYKREYLNESLRKEFKKLMQNATGLKFT